MKRKNILLTLGSLATVVAPITTAVSCGRDANLETQKTNNTNSVLVVPENFALPATTATATVKRIDLDDLLLNASKSDVLDKMQAFFAGEYNAVHLQNEDISLEDFEHNFKLKQMLEAYVYKLSQKFPRIIISTPAGEKVFNPNLMIDVAAWETNFKAAGKVISPASITSAGAGKSIYLKDSFPKAPEHSHYTFQIPELIPEVREAFKNDELMKELRAPGIAWEQNIDGEIETVVGQYLAPNNLNDTFTLKIGLEFDKGYIPKSFFEKTIQMKIVKRPFSEIKDAALNKYFNNNILSMNQTLSSGISEFQKIKSEIKNIFARATTSTYPLVGASSRPNLDGLLAAWKPNVNLGPSWLEGMTWNEGQMHQIKHLSELIKIAEGIDRLVNMYPNGTPANAVSTVTPLISQYDVGGAHEDPTPIIADPSGAGYMSITAFNAAIDAATSLHDLKVITDKYAPVSASGGNPAHPGIPTLVGYDYQSHIKSIAGVSDMTTAQTVLNGIHNITELKTAFNGNLPAVLASKEFTVGAA